MASSDLFPKFPQTCIESSLQKYCKGFKSFEYITETYAKKDAEVIVQ